MAIKFLAGNRLTGLESDTPPDLTTDMKGATFFESDTQNIYVWNGSAWVLSVANELAQEFSLKTFTDSLIIEEISAPGNAPSDSVRLYANGGKLYSRDDDNNTYDLTAGAGSTSTIAGASDTDISSASSAHVLIYDGSNSWDNKPVSGDVTISTAGAVTLGNTAITGRAAETSLQTANDLVLVYDNSASALKKVTVSNLLSGGVSADTLLALSDTTISSPASAQVLIYDGTDSWDNRTLSGDVTVGNTGTTAITADVIVNADIKSDAAIAISKTALAAGTGITLSTNTLNVDAAQTQITSVGALDAGSITSGFTSIDVGSGAITTTGTITAGTLVVTGSTTTINTATVTVEDPLMILASGNNAADAVDIGFYGLYDTSGSQDLYSGLFRDASDSGKWKLFKDNQSAPTTTVAEGTGYAVATLVANIEGNITGSSGSTTGNAATVTNGVYTTGDQTINGAKTFGSTIVGSISGNAATATSAATLTTGRNIGGVSFNGSADINLPGVNSAGNQNTSGTAAGLSATLAVTSGGTGQTSYTKGDLIAANSSTLAKLAIGSTTGHVLTVDPAEATGMKWAAASGGGSGASESFAIAMAVGL